MAYAKLTLARLVGEWVVMRSRLTLAISVLVATSIGCAADDKWFLSGATDLRYFSWDGNRGFLGNAPSDQASFPGNAPSNQASGQELYAPVAFELVGRPSDDFSIDFIARGGWVWARQSAPGLTGEVDTITDTAFSGTVTYYGWKGIQPFVSLGMNLPTGKPALFGPSANARMDPNLVDIATFGEGFNIGPTVGFTLPVSKDLLLTLSAGHTWRGTSTRQPCSRLRSRSLCSTVRQRPSIPATSPP